EPAPKEACRPGPASFHVPRKADDGHQSPDRHGREARFDAGRAAISTDRGTQVLVVCLLRFGDPLASHLLDPALALLGESNELGVGPGARPVPVAILRHAPIVRAKGSFPCLVRSNRAEGPRTKGRGRGGTPPGGT